MNDTGNKETGDLTADISEYWNKRIHDLEMTDSPIGSKGFFEDLDEYRFDKLRYLPKMVDFSGFSGKKLLEIGCGIGIDLVRFARGGAEVTGIDLSETAINLAKKNFEINGLESNLHVMDAEALEFTDGAFDVVYGHGVLPYAASPQKMIDEAYRVLKPGGILITQAYNRKGWLYYMSKFFKVGLEHEDAPAFNLHKIKQFKKMFANFSEVKIIPTRFPVKSRLHKGLKGFLYNTFFVGLFKIIPRPLVRRWGWHIMAFATK